MRKRQQRQCCCAAIVLFALMLVGRRGRAGSAPRHACGTSSSAQPVAAQPAPEEFRGFACGSNGGAPRQQLTGWTDFARCRAEPDGLHEVYFEYDDELEYIARAQDLDREITRWAGTTERGFPVVVSALFDDAGVLKGIRMVTDSRPDYRNDVTEANLRKRDDAYVLGGIMAARFDIDAGARLQGAAAGRRRERGRRRVRQAGLRDERRRQQAQDHRCRSISCASPARAAPIRSCRRN